MNALEKKGIIVATREALLAYATTKIGTIEHPPYSNCNEFSESLHRPCESWCADFVVACMRSQGIQLPSESAWTVAMFNGFLGSGTAVHDIAKGLQPGDVVLYDFVPPFNTTGIQHTGIFVRYIDTFTIEAIEGNTSSGNGGSQDNGGGVYKRGRPLKFVVGAGRPGYTPFSTPVNPNVPVSPEEAEVAVTIARPQGGYINVGKDGGVFAYRGAPFFGSVPGVGVHVSNVLGGAWTPTGLGYWILTKDGAVFSFGDAAYHGGFNGFDAATRGNRYAVGIVQVGNGYVITTFDPSNDGTPYDEYAFGV